jgi:vancomycin resistance protein YoaR
MGTPSAGVPAATARPTRARSRAERLLRTRQLVSSRLRLAAAIGAFAVVVLLFAAVVERLVYSGEVMPGVNVEGVSLSGKSEPAAYRDLRALAARLEREPVRARAGDTNLTADPGLLHYQVDAVATLRAAREAGRSRNPLEQVAGTVLRRFRDDDVDLTASYDAESVEGLLDAWTAQTSDGVVEGGVRFAGTRVVEIEPHAGTGILRADARRLVRERLRSGHREVLVLPVGRVEPELSAGDVDRAAARARALLADNVVITAGLLQVTLTPEQVAPTLDTAIVDGALTLSVDPQRLRNAMGDQISQLTSAPVDARFEVTSEGGVNVIPSVAGRELNLNAVSRAIARGRHKIVAPLREVEPEHDTAWAKNLGIKELVSTFTTNHPSGQERVKNIHRGADLINNLVVEPGQVFSLDQALGPRTAERGFVSAPVFYGEFTEDFGGGVSQLATTFFNTIFFGGYEIIAHKPHTIYISRYPMGRESTINYGTVDVKFRNDSKHGILIRTGYSESSITVNFYGDKEGKVVRAEGPNVLATRPPTDELVDWPLLPAGTVERAEEGYTGYDVENFRVIERPGQPPVRQRFFWRYKMIPNKVLVGTAPPPPPSTPTTTAPKGRRPPGTTTPTPSSTP